MTFSVAAAVLSLSCSDKDPAGPDPKDDQPKDTALSPVGTLSFSGFNTAPMLILVESPFAYIACTNGSFMVVDVSDTLNPQVVDSFPVVGDSLFTNSYGGGNYITKSGNLVCFVALAQNTSVTPSRAQLFSVSPQGSITHQATIAAPYSQASQRYEWMSGNVTLSGNLLYLDGDVYDVTSPLNPQSLGSLENYYSLGYALPVSQSPVVVYGNYVAFAGVYQQHPRLWICDRSTRQVAGTLNLPDTIGHTRLSVVSGTAYVYGSVVNSSLSRYVAEVSLASITSPALDHTYSITEMTVDGLLWFGDSRIARSRYHSAQSLDVGLAICDLNFTRVKANDTLEVYACAITSTHTYVGNSAGFFVFRTP